MACPSVPLESTLNADSPSIEEPFHRGVTGVKRNLANQTSLLQKKQPITEPSSVMSPAARQTPSQGPKRQAWPIRGICGSSKRQETAGGSASDRNSAPVLAIWKQNLKVLEKGHKN
jgi:hypothetical protein